VLLTEDEYNEILDSATLIVSQRTTKIVISPFDLVVVTGNNFVTRRLVVDTVTERIISFDPLIYDYQINLFSETKLLEHYVLPNLSITQPANKTQKKSISFYLLKYMASIPNIHIHANFYSGYDYIFF
jgi:hypothetical protein